MENKVIPDYAQCVKISTFLAQRKILVPLLVAIFLPVLVGMVLGVPGTVGLLGGALSSGFVFFDQINGDGFGRGRGHYRFP